MPLSLEAGWAASTTQKDTPVAQTQAQDLQPMVWLDGESNLVGRRRNNTINGGRYGKVCREGLKQDTTGGWDYWGGGTGQDTNPKKVINSTALQMIGPVGS